MPKKIKVQCNETGQVFNTLTEASIWLKGDIDIKLRPIRSKLGLMISEKKFKVPTRKSCDGKTYYTQVKSIFGYTFRKVE